MSERYVAAIDQGTTSTRCLVFDRQGRLVALAQQQHTQHYPRPGWVEHDAAEIWSLVRRLLPEALRNGGLEASQIVSLGLTNQRETVVVWDRRHRRTRRPRPSSGRTPDRRPASTHIAGQLDPACLHRPNRAPPRHLLHRPQAALAAGERRSPAAPCGGRGAPVRHDGHVAAVESHGRRQRRRPRDRRDERQPHHADEPPDPAVGPRAPRGHARPEGRPARDPAHLGRARHHRRPRPRHTCECRHRRPAGFPLRTDGFRVRRGQVHVRHRRLHAAQHRHRSRQVDARPRDDGCAPGRGRADRLRARGVGRRRPVPSSSGAARAWASSGHRAEIETLAASVDDNGGCFDRAGLRGPLRAALGEQREGSRRRPDRLHHRRAPRPRGARGGRVQARRSLPR